MKIVSQTLVLMLVVGLVGSSITGCASLSRGQKGGAIGAATGAAVGAAIGKTQDQTIMGALIGAAIGGTAGALIGRQMDKQAEEMEQDLQGARIERVAEGIKIHFDSGILFAVDKSSLGSQAQTNLTRLAAILQKYPDTNILIEGHTDATGSHDHNMQLSEQRASAVKAFLVGQGVDGARMTPAGYGPDQPVATNDTAEGRQLNRRVEIAVMANEKMKKAAEDMSKG